MQLKWEQTEDFEFRASSSWHDEGSHFEYVIVSCSVDDCLFFSVGNSAGELVSERDGEILFRRLDDAQYFCELLERKHGGGA